MAKRKIIIELKVRQFYI